uniref:Transposase n=1 Tax=Bursaphelenchus xylophilus TaxID=6326 RepID=A0A1I7SN32_BURXY
LSKEPSRSDVDRVFAKILNWNAARRLNFTARTR